MKVVILCGGLGTRLREETEFRPKPMVMVGGKPILWHIMKIYAHYGFNEFVLCLGYKGDIIKQYFLNYQMMSNDFTLVLDEAGERKYHTNHTETTFKITFAETGLNTMTGGRIKRIEPYIDSDTFMITYGDGVSNVDLKALVDFHQSHDNIATVTAIQPTSRFGVLEMDDSCYVTSFLEKPRMPTWTSAGFFVCNRQIFDYIEGDDTVLEASVMRQLTAERELRVYRHEGFFFAMDTYREYLQLNRLWDDQEAPWKIWD